MNDNDDIRTIPDPSPSSAPTPAAETKSPAQPPFAVAQLPPAPLRIPLAVLNVAWVITGYTPDEFLRSLDVLVELAPGVLVEPQQLQWHPMLNRFVYLSPNGGMFDLERIVRALKLGDDVEPYCRDDNGTPFDPGKWRQLSFVIPGDDEPYCSRQRYDAVLGTTFQVFELVNRDTRPASTQWPLAGANQQPRVLPGRHGLRRHHRRELRQRRRGDAGRRSGYPSRDPRLSLAAGGARQYPKSAQSPLQPSRHPRQFQQQFPAVAMPDENILLRLAPPDPPADVALRLRNSAKAAPLPRPRRCRPPP